MIYFLLAVSSIDWTNVIVAFIFGLPSIIGAVGVWRVHGQITTPSGKSIGRQVEDSLHVALANNMHINAVGRKVGAISPLNAEAEETKVPGLTEANGTHEPKETG